MEISLLRISTAVFVLALAAGLASGGAESVTAGAAGTKGESRRWPVDIPVHLSSSFAEYRSGHLHAGVDIRCFGREGVPCRAVEAGYVSRLRASAFGYGKAVYVALETGETAVYAHLSEFSARIDSVVRKEQERRGTYQVDFYPARGELGVARGDIVGYTGRTGTASPHLHWEIRDQGENPVNPLDLGWELDDEVPPTIRRVEWLPLDAGSRVDGACAPALVELRGVDANTYAARETLAVEGRLGLAAEIHDRLDENSGTLAPYSVELEVDGVVLASIEMKRFSYEHTLEVELAYDMTRSRTRGQHFMFLFRREGETLWNREFVGGGAIVTDSLEAGEGDAAHVHTAVVRAVDRAGHVSTASVPFVVPDRGPAGAGGAGPAARAGGRSRGEIASCYFFEGLLSIAGTVEDPAGPAPRNAASAAGGEGAAGNTAETVYTVASFGTGPRNIRVRDRGSAVTLAVLPARKGSAARCSLGDEGAVLSVGADCLYADSFLYLARWEGDARRALPEGSGLAVETHAVRLGPMSAAFKRPVAIRFSLSRPASGKEAVFRFDAREGAWSARPTAARGDALEASVREPGIYAVLSDTLAPAVGAPQVRSRKSHATLKSVREIVVSIADGGSGIDSDATAVYVDGKKQIGRWDGFSQKVFVLMTGQNIIGVHDVKIVASDRVGNVSERVTRIEIPPPAPKGGAQGRR
jgi:hypothetical protein